jgi:hypothetical protein
VSQFDTAVSAARDDVANAACSCHVEHSKGQLGRLHLNQVRCPQHRPAPVVWCSSLVQVMYEGKHETVDDAVRFFSDIF